MGRVWAIGHVCGEAIGCCKSRAFANQEHDNSRRKQLADFIQYRNAAVPNNERLSDSPSTLNRGLIKKRYQSRNLRRHWCRKFSVKIARISNSAQTASRAAAWASRSSSCVLVG